MLSALLGRKIATPDGSENEYVGVAAPLPAKSLRPRFARAGVCALLLAVWALVASPARGQSVTATAADTNAPHGIAINPITNKIYVADLFGTLTVIDGATNASSTMSYGGNEAWAVAVNTATNTVYVADRGNSNVYVFSGAIGSSPASLVATISTGDNNLYDIGVNPITNMVYAADDGNFRINVINGSTNTIVTDISNLPIFPACIAINPVTDMIYVVDGDTSNLLVINGSTNALAVLPSSNPNPITVGTTPVSIAVNPVTNQIFVANMGSNNVSVVNGATGLVTATLHDSLASGPTAVAANPVINQLYVANAGSSNATVINLADDTVIDVPTNAGTSSLWASVSVDTSTNVAYFANSANGTVNVITYNGSNYVATQLTVQPDAREIAVNPVTHKVYAAPGSDSSTVGVSVIDGATNAPVSQPSYGGSKPWAIAVDPVRNYIYVADNGASDVSVIDGASNTVLTTVGVGTSPNALLVDPINNLVYVSNSGSSSVSVFGGPSSPPATISLNYNYSITPNFLAFNPVLNQVYGASSNGLGFSFAGGSSSQSVTASTFFAGAIPVAIGTNPAQGYNYAVFSNDSSMQISDVHGGAGFGVCSGPTAADVNTTTDVIYVACTDGSVDAVEQADAFTPGTGVSIPLPGSPHTPTAVAVNSVTNKVYVTDSASTALYVINSASNNTVATIDLTNAVSGLYVCETPVSLALNIASNKIYVLCQGDVENVPMVVAIDGATNAILAAVEVGSSNTQVNGLNNELAVNPVTGDIYALAYMNSTPLTLFPENIFQTDNLKVTSIGLDPSNANNSGTTTISTTAAFAFAANNTLVPSGPVTGVYFQVDTMQGVWTAAAPVVAEVNNFTGTASGLTPGFHILYAYATDGQDATSGNSGPNSDQDGPLVGAITSYGFLVAPPIATINTYTLVFDNTPVGGMSSSPNPILINEGGAPMSYSWNIGGSNPNEFVPDLSQSSCAASGTLAPNTYCEIYVSFQPNAPGPATATLTWTDNSLSVNNSMQSVGFSGTGTASVTPPTLSESASNPSYNQDPIFAWSDTEPNVTYQCSFTTGMTVSPNYIPCSSGVDYSGLVENDYYTWSVEAVDASSNISSPVTVTWQVIPSSVTVTLAGSGTGTVSSLPSGITCPATVCTAPFNGVSVNLTATATGTSVFAGWTPTYPNAAGNSCAGTTQPCTLNTNNGPQPVTATFNAPAANYTLTITELGTGTGTITDGTTALDCVEQGGTVFPTCSRSYPSGTMVTLTATPGNDGSTFTGWTGACANYLYPQPCVLTMNSNLGVTADFLPPAQVVTLTFPVSTVPVTEQTTFDCPGNLTAGPGNPCLGYQGPSAHSISLGVQSSQGFSVQVTATEVPPSQYDGICESNMDDSLSVQADFDCRFLNFFKYGSDIANTGGAIVPFCYPFANGNCVHYEVNNGTVGQEPDPSKYLGPVNWVITWNNDALVAPGPYWTGSTPQLYDNPDSPPTPQSAFGTSCASAMLIGSTPQGYFCQFEFDITTFYNPTEPVDSGIGGSTKAFNDVVIAWPPTNSPGNANLPLLNANSAPDSPSVSYGSGIGFTITLTNNGTTTASGITLNDPLPTGAGVNWVLASTTPSLGGCSIVSGTLSCPAFSVATGAMQTFHVTSSAAGVGVYSNVATFMIGTQQTLGVAALTVQGITASFSGLSSNSITAGTPTETLTGTVGSSNYFPPAGETVTITINGNLQSTMIVGPNGGFSYAFPTAAIPASGTPYTVTYNYPGDANFSSASDSTTTLTVSSPPPAETLTVTELGTGTGSVSGGNINCSEANGIGAGTCTDNYGADAYAMLTATPTAPSTFAGWTGCTTTNGTSCTVIMTSNETVTANFIPPPTTVTVTFPVSSIPVTETAAYNCPGNPNPISVSNPCLTNQGPDATAVQLTVQGVSTGFSVSVTATEVPPSLYDGICESNSESAAGVAADFDCRFLNFFKYGTDPSTQGAIVPFCVPYSNGNCVHYEVIGSGGNEPNPSSYLGPVNWLITWNNESVAPPPSSYWSSANPTPQLYDDPDSPPTPQSAFGTNCSAATPMQIGSTPQTYFCQFEFDITTAYYPTQVVDSGIGGSTKAFNDVVVAWPPTNVPNNLQLPLLNAISTTSPAGGSTNFGNAIGFTVKLTNNGTTTASGITLNDPLPSGATWTLGSTSIAGCSIIGTSPQTLNCQSLVGGFSLAPSISATFVVNSTNAAAGIYSNVATFTIGTQQTLAVATVVVNAVTSSTGLTPSMNPSVSGQPVTFTATVAPIPTVGDIVTFKNGLATLGTGMTNALGVATYTTSALVASGSPYSITAVFPGDTSVGPSTSTPALSQVVNKANTTTGLISSLNPSISGQLVTFTATVAPIPSTGDTVTFKDGSTTLGTGTTNASGVATFPISTLSATAHSITAVFAGDSNYTTSTSSILTQTVNAATSALKFTPASLNFGNVYVGNTELLATTITNTGGSMVTFSKFAVAAITGDDSTGYLGIAFCPSTLNAGRSCTIIMSFTADSSVTKIHAANLVITDNGAGSPQSIPMSATVINPKVSLSSSSISFGNQTTGTTSAAKSVKLTNSGTTQLNLTGLSISGTGFTLATGTNACTATTMLNPAATCVIYVTFKPALPKGSKSGSIKITDNAQNSSQTISLYGNGT